MMFYNFCLKFFSTIKKSNFWRGGKLKWDILYNNDKKYIMTMKTRIRAMLLNLILDC